VTSAGTAYTLCHQNDSWSNGQWRLVNFNVNSGTSKSVQLAK
jgi:hypothetical protein